MYMYEEKNILMSDSLGIVDLKSELLVKNYDVDKPRNLAKSVTVE